MGRPGDAGGSGRRDGSGRSPQSAFPTRALPSILLAPKGYEDDPLRRLHGAPTAASSALRIHLCGSRVTTTRDFKCILAPGRIWPSERPAKATMSEAGDAFGDGDDEFGSDLGGSDDNLESVHDDEEEDEGEDLMDNVLECVPERFAPIARWRRNPKTQQQQPPPAASHADLATRTPTPMQGLPRYATPGQVRGRGIGSGARRLRRGSGARGEAQGGGCARRSRRGPTRRAHRPRDRPRSPPSPGGGRG